MEKEDLKKLRHSCSHVMAHAVVNIFPGVKLGIGPATDEGFYYDFDIPGGAKEEDLEKIEAEMRKIVQEDVPFQRETWKRKEAIEYFSKKEESYKVQLIEELPDEEVSVYKSGDFLDLCKGPHVESTGQVKHFKLLSIAGSYWKGNENNPMLTRIYGTAFFSKDDLKQYLKRMEEVIKRDHRVLGKKLELFDIYYNEAGAGLVFWKPKGALLRRTIEDWLVKENLKRGHLLLTTPHILKADLWKTSGHMDYYRDLMFIVNTENQDFVVKPMNCPGHILIYKAGQRSYRDFPLRYFELGTVYRHEKSGVLHGLLRVRGFTQDDAHVFLEEEQVQDEVVRIIDFVKYTLNTFGFPEFEVELSTQPREFIGTQEMWDKATVALENALKKSGVEYDVNPGEGAFYGPKIDIKIKDCLGRSWQCSTIQVDFAIPQRFNLHYVDRQGEFKRPVMIHRAILGSLERFIGTLIEHHEGIFPLWLAPVQVKVLALKDEVCDYVLKVGDLLKEQGFRAEVDVRNERLQKKIRDAEEEKIPYICVAGPKEKEEGSIDIRKKKQGRVGTMKIEEFLNTLKEEVKSSGTIE